MSGRRSPRFSSRMRSGYDNSSDCPKKSPTRSGCRKETAHDLSAMRHDELPLLGSNQDSPDPESGVLPVTPRGRNGFVRTLNLAVPTLSINPETYRARGPAETFRA